MSTKSIILCIAGFFLFCFLSSLYTVIPAGYAGVMFNRMTGNMRSVGQGAAFKLPFVTTVQAYPVSLRTYTMAMKDKDGDDSMDLPTKEGQHIKQDLSVTYNTSPDKAADVFRSFKGANIENI